MSKRFLLLFFLFLSVAAYSQRYSSSRKSKSNYKEPIESSGFRNGMDFSASVGYPFSFGLDYVASYQFNSYLQTGVGVGIQPSAFLGGSAFMFPFYLDLRYNIFPTKVTPFLGAKAGGIGSFEESRFECYYYLAAMPGCRFNVRGQKSVFLSTGPTFIFDKEWVIPGISLSFRVFFQF